MLKGACSTFNANHFLCRNATPAGKPTLSDPTVAYRSPVSPPRRPRRQKVSDKLRLLSRLPTPGDSFSLVYDAGNGMDVDDNPSSSPFLQIHTSVRLFVYTGCGFQVAGKNTKLR
jgi:hypothetical protein